MGVGSSAHCKRCGRRLFSSVSRKNGLCVCCDEHAQHHKGTRCGCGKPIHAKGLCKACYERKWRAENRDRARLHSQRQRIKRPAQGAEELMKDPINPAQPYICEGCSDNYIEEGIKT